MAVVSMVVGATTDGGATFVTKVDTGPVRIKYSVNSDMSSASFSSSTAVDAQGVAKVAITGLTADTQYYWQVEDNGTVDTGTTGKVKTFPTLGDPANFTFAAASCSGQSGAFSSDGVSNHPVFDTIRSKAPLFFIHDGDLHYRNISTNSVSDFRDAYDDVLAQSRQHQLYREVPWVYTWDDHDFGGDDSDGTSDAAPAAQSVYRERVPHYPLDDSAGIYQAFGCGRVLLIVSDTRSFRSPDDDTDSSSKTMLGSDQKDWIEATLASPGFDAQFLVWVSSSVWLTDSSDSWSKFATERTEMVGIFDDWLDRMCVISGDMHALAIATEAANDHGGFPVFQFASLESSPTTHHDGYDLGQMPGYNQYGLVSVVDTGDAIAVTGTGYVGSRPWQWYTVGTGTSRTRGPKPVAIAL